MADPIKRIELKDGSVRYRFEGVDIGRDPVTGRRIQLTRTFDTKREAKAELARVRHEVGTGTYVRPSAVTVDRMLDEWLATATRDVEEATAANYRAAMLPVRARLGHRRLQSVTEADAEALVDHMLTSGRKRGGKPGTGLSARSVRLTLGRFRAALNDAVRRQLVVRNVAAFTTLPRSATNAAAEVKAKREPWTIDEVKAFLAGIKGDRLHAVMLLSLMGLRPAEVCGLRWSDVDLVAGTLKVAKTRTLVEGRVVEKDAKTAAGKRGLPLPAAVVVALKAFKKTQAAEKLAAGEGYADSGRVLVDEAGQAVKTDWLRRRFVKLMTDTGVRVVRLYDARHACLTYLATSGVPDVVVSAWAGHADLSFTKKEYVHPDMGHLKVAADQLNKMLG